MTMGNKEAWCPTDLPDGAQALAAALLTAVASVMPYRSSGARNYDGSHPYSYLFCWILAVDFLWIFLAI